MKSTQYMISQTMDLLIFFLAILFTIVWIIRRRKIRREEIKAKNLEKRPYNTLQVFGMIGIIVFILPIFWAVGVMLQKGLYILAILLFGWIGLPNTISIIAKSIFFLSTYFLLFYGVFFVCEFMWPKRYIAIGDLDSEKKDDKKSAPK